MNWRFFKKKKTPVQPARYRLFLRKELATCGPYPDYGITLIDYAICIFSCEGDLNSVAFAEQLGTLTVITFGNKICDITKQQLDYIRPVGCFVKYETN